LDSVSDIQQIKSNINTTNINTTKSNKSNLRYKNDEFDSSELSYLQSSTKVQEFEQNILNDFNREELRFNNLSKNETKPDLLTKYTITNPNIKINHKLD